MREELARTSGRRGQIAFEFLIIYSTLMIIFVAALYVIGERAATQQTYAEQIFAREVTLRFADEINTAALFPGYWKNYTFSKTIRGAIYSLSVSNGAIAMNYTSVTEAVFIYPLTTDAINVSGASTTGLGNRRYIDTTKGWMLLQNINGTVVIE